MHKYHGTVIHKSRDETGEIEIIDDVIYRSLHFGSEPKQSSMLLRDPLHLALAYTRAMACSVLFHQRPGNSLLIGLGGGSLAKFLLHYLPQCRVDAVETREAVVEVARTHFHLPDDPRLRLHIDDGGSFVRDLARQRTGGYDLIFVDAFLDSGIARSVCGISFFDACRELLNEGGVFSMNLWNGDFITAREMLKDIRGSFDGNVLKLPVDGKDNTIALAARGVTLRPGLNSVQQRAQQLEQESGVEFTLLLRQMKKHNHWLQRQGG